MNEQWLESLLKDQALHGLSLEVEQLLNAYMAEHPECQSLADSIHQTAELGQRAAAAELPTELPAFPRERITGQRTQIRWPSQVGWRAMAACLVIGLGIGFSLKYTRSTVTRTIRPAEVLRVEGRPLAEGESVTRAFWSVETYQSRYKQYRASSRSKIGQSIYGRYGKGGLL